MRAVKQCWGRYGVAVRASNERFRNHREGPNVGYDLGAGVPILHLLLPCLGAFSIVSEMRR